MYFTIQNFLIENSSYAYDSAGTFSETNMDRLPEDIFHIIGTYPDGVQTLKNLVSWFYTLKWLEFIISRLRLLRATVWQLQILKEIIYRHSDANKPPYFSPVILCIIYFNANRHQWTPLFMLMFTLYISNYSSNTSRSAKASPAGHISQTFPNMPL